MPAPLTHDDPTGLGAYRLLARLGSGGMGTVYLARSPGGRTVALKTMHARIAAEASFRTRFRLEADAARVIGGQYGAQVVDADPLAETPWLATEYVIGPPLDDAVDLAGPLPEPSVRALGAGLCVALGQLHRSDVVHRDLKPSNIMVTAYGPKIIDFGIARAIGDQRLTHTGAAVGTPAFMSPEQATGQEHSPAGDVFALAGVLVFAVTGSGPFGSGQPADLLYRVRYEKPDLTRVPPALAPVLERCLDKDPARRPTTAQLVSVLHDGRGEFAEHLPDLVLDDIGRRAAEIWQPVPERLAPPDGGQPSPDDVGTVLQPGPSRRRLLFLGAGAGVAAVAAGAGVWAWRESGPDGKVPETGAKGPVERKPVWDQKSENDGDDDYPAAPFLTGKSVIVTGTFPIAYDLRTGRLAWKEIVLDPLRFGQVAAWDGAVYTFVDYGDRASLSEGKKPWPLQIGTVDLSNGYQHKPFARFDMFNGQIEQNQMLCVANGVLYMAICQGPYSDYGLDQDQKWFIAAFDIATKKFLWSTPMPALILEAEGESDFRILSGRAVGRNLVTLRDDTVATGGKVRHVIHAVVHDLHTGKIRWDKPVDMESLYVPLAVDDTCLYVGGKRVCALRLSDGRQMWAVRARASGGTFGPPSVKGKSVYIVEKSVGLVAVDARSGRRLWAEDTDDADRADLTVPPALASTYAYYRNGVDIRAVGLTSRRPALTYSVDADRFVIDTRQRMLVAVGKQATYGIPVQ